MIFNYELGMKKCNECSTEVNYREALRAVILKEDKLLMVKTNKGDYKFPGGGADEGETHKETLIREVEEETGYVVSTVKEKLGVIVERSIDGKNGNAIFEMISNYYLCQVSTTVSKQKLDDYEKELDFKGEWVTIDEAIAANEAILISWTSEKNPWVYRETIVLKELKNI